MYKTSQGRLYHNDKLILDTDINKTKIKDNLRIIRELTNINWKRTKEAIHNSKGDTIPYKVYTLTKLVINLGIKAYLKGEPIVKSFTVTNKGRIPYTHVGKLPTAQRDKRN